jgi:hypothetical protein
MSAPKTNIDRQVAHHRGPLFGMIAIGGFVIVLLMGWQFFGSDGASDATEVVPADPAPGTTAAEATQP